MKLVWTSLLALVLAPLAAAQDAPYQPPRTADGRPDLQGVWSNKWLTPLEKTGGLDALSLPPQQAIGVVAMIRGTAVRLANLANDPEAGDPDAHSLAVVGGEHRTRLIIDPADGALPYTEAGKKAVQAHQAWFFQRVTGARGDGPEDRLTWERCLAGMGQAPLLYGWAINGMRRIVQTPEHLVIHSEAGGETRIIRIGGAPLPAGMASYAGDSTGGWDGDTLVVKTTGFKPDDQFRMFVVGRPIMVSPQATVVERFTRASGGEINYRFTVEDPAIYAAPWTAEYAMVATTEPMYEFACHEGNYGLANILKGARAAEAAAQRK